jgi:hypothetical protein
MRTWAWRSRGEWPGAGWRDAAGFTRRTRDWLTLQSSALLYTSRLWIQWEQAMLNRFLKPASVVPQRA